MERNVYNADIASPRQIFYLKDCGGYEDKTVVYCKIGLLKVWTGKTYLYN